MTKRDLFRKTPSPWIQLWDYLPLIVFILIFIMVFGVLIYCQSSIAYYHTIEGV